MEAVSKLYTHERNTVAELAYHSRLVSLGALATIMLLAFPSFIQQAVNIQPKAYPLPGVGLATLQRLVEFTNTSGLNDDWDVFAAMDNGLINSHVYPSNASANCPTEHCTWEPYTTIGVSVTADNVTNLLVRGPDMPAVVPQDHHSFERPEDGDEGYLNISTFQLDTRWLGSEQFPTPPGSDGRLSDLAHIYLSYYDPCLNVDANPDWRDLRYWRGFKATFKLSLLRLKSTYSQSMNTEIVGTYDDLPWIVSPEPSATGLVERQLYCAQEESSPESFCIRSDKLAALGENLDWALNPDMVRGISF